MAGFFDKVVDGINKGVSSVSEGSKNLVGKAKLNMQIQEMEGQKNKILQNIGSFVYNMAAEGTIDIPQCDEMCEEVAKINHKIAEIQEQIKNLDAPKTQAAVVSGIICSCGFTNVEGARFCAKCGNPLS